MLLVILILNAIVISGATTPELLKRQGAPDIRAQDCLNPLNFDRDTITTGCTPRLSTNPDGSCPVSVSQQCASYCQKTVSWNYGYEVPFSGSRCDRYDLCTIAETKSVSFTNEYSFEIGGSLGTLRKRAAEDLDILKAAFNFGSTWSWSETVTNATAITHTRPDNQNDTCGYWTFVPYYITSCGTLSIGDESILEVSCDDIQTTENWCQTVAYLDADGNPGGATIFVAQSCLGGWPLSFCWQDSIYLIPGVSTNTTLYNDYVIAHENYDMTQPVESTPSIMCRAGEGPFNEDNS